MAKPQFDYLHGTTAESFSVGVRCPADASAALEIESTDRGFLPPRMSAVQREAILLPTNGLVVYDTDAHTLYLRSNGVWVPLNRDMFVPADNSSVPTGQFGYISSNDKVSRTDAMLLRKSRCLGVNPGISGVMQVGGLYRDAVFSNECPTPEVGKSVFLARMDDETLGDARGKLTPLSPSSGVVAEVGLVLHIEADFSTTRVADVVIQIRGVTKRAS